MPRCRTLVGPRTVTTCATARGMAPTVAVGPRSAVAPLVPPRPLGSAPRPALTLAVPRSAAAVATGAVATAGAFWPTPRTVVTTRGVTTACAIVATRAVVPPGPTVVPPGPAIVPAGRAVVSRSTAVVPPREGLAALVLAPHRCPPVGALTGAAVAARRPRASRRSLPAGGARAAGRAVTSAAILAGRPGSVVPTAALVARPVGGRTFAIGAVVGVVHQGSLPVQKCADHPPTPAARGQRPLPWRQHAARADDRARCGGW